MISVIMPVYNRVNMMRNAVNSFISQMADCELKGRAAAGGRVVLLQSSIFNLLFAVRRSARARRASHDPPPPDAGRPDGR